MDVIAIPAFTDNYIWLVRHGRHAAVVDPGDPGPVERYLSLYGLDLSAVLITHHHPDHTGGIAALSSKWAVPVFGPRNESIKGITRPVGEPDLIQLPGLDAEFSVLDIPGHTRGHVAYYGANLLFCGDTLFGGGCGRVFEGTPAQMHSSLMKIAALPGHTRVYCAHEYTEANLRFALRVEPENGALAARLSRVMQMRAAFIPSLPTRLEEERATNPFLRATEPAVIEAAKTRGAREDAVSVFAAIREWKNQT
ncbi:MAG: hypothetical protein RIR70_1396 [Pseudomonadota bacterium]